MNKSHVVIIRTLWGRFFPKDKFSVHDKRLDAISLFYDFFLDSSGSKLIDQLDLANDNSSIYFDVGLLNDLLPFPDFMQTLQTQPNEVIGCFGLALSVLKTHKLSNNLAEPFCIWPRFQNFGTFDLPFGDLKSGTVGKLVSIKGYVVRAGPCKPLIEQGCFQCNKCLRNTWVSFEDGVFQPPDQCGTEK